MLPHLPEPCELGYVASPSLTCGARPYPAANLRALNGYATARHCDVWRHRPDGTIISTWCVRSSPSESKAASLLPNGDRVMPDPILVGRNAEKVAALARQYGIERSTTDLDAALKDPKDEVFFDAATTQMRADLLTKAIEAGKHVYCEKPVADSLDKAIAVAKLAKAKKVKNGVVQDKLFLPGLRKIKMLREAGFFGRMFAVRGEFGYWVFEGDWVSRRSGRAGIIARPRAAASFSICSVIGATCSTICSARCRR